MLRFGFFTDTTVFVSSDHEDPETAIWSTKPGDGQMSNKEMNRRLSTLNSDQIAHIQRLIRNGYDARWIQTTVRKFSLAQVNAVFQLDTHWGNAA